MATAQKNNAGWWICSGGYASHFHESETACKCGCGENKVSQILLDKVEILRLKLGKPIVINSGYRCETWNKRVGGAPSSAHRIGEGWDIYCPRIQLSQLYLFAERENFTGFGSYPESKPPFLHLDCLDNRVMRWIYRQGKYWYAF